jgi:hypothetical protein
MIGGMRFKVEEQQESSGTRHGKVKADGRVILAIFDAISFSAALPTCNEELCPSPPSSTSSS